VKSDVTVLEKAIDRCKDQKIPDFFKMFPEEVKSDATMIEKVIDRCRDLEIFELSEKFPEKVKKKEEICTACLEKIPLDSLNSLWGKIPDELKTSGPAFQVMNRRGGTGTVMQKHASLLSIAPRLLLVAAFVYGFIELIVLGFGKLLGEETLDTHWRQAPDQSWVFAPLPDCLLPPPPSTWISGCMDAVKAGAFTLMFGYMDRHLHDNQHKLAGRTKRVVFVMASLFQLIIVPMSSAFAVYHFITEVYPKQPIFSAGYQCFFIGWNSSFLDFSYWLLLVRVIGTHRIMELSKLSYDSCEHRKSQVCLDPKGQLKELPATLLSSDDSYTSIGALEVTKSNVTINAFLITAGIYVLIDLPFTLTHKLLASIVFLPFLLVMAVAIVIIFRFTWPDGFNVLWNHRTKGDSFLERLFNAFDDKLDWDFAERTGAR
jgi:hypothetical protein